MTEEEREFEKMKMKLIIKCMNENFEKRVYQKLTSDELKTMSDIDEWLTQELSKHVRDRDAISQYYASKMYS